MKKIVLLCAAGMSTSLLVNKMKEASISEGLDYDINAYSISEARIYGAEAAVILLGPQVRFNLSKISEEFPNTPVEAIDMVAYGTMDGAKVIARVKELIGD